jgi:uncharacterized protein YfaP (DUF2135 family)
MLPYRDSTLTKIALVVFFLIIAGYAYFEATGILYGPSIQVSQTIEQVSTPYIELTGTTTHIQALTMNGQSIPVTEAGAFDIPYALSPGYNRIVLDATDKYGKTTEKIIQVVYTPATSTASVSATTTAAATSTTSTSTVQ